MGKKDERENRGRDDLREMLKGGREGRDGRREEGGRGKVWRKMEEGYSLVQSRYTVNLAAVNSEAVAAPEASADPDRRQGRRRMGEEKREEGRQLTRQRGNGGRKTEGESA